MPHKGKSGGTTLSHLAIFAIFTRFSLRVSAQKINLLEYYSIHTEDILFPENFRNVFRTWLFKSGMLHSSHSSYARLANSSSLAFSIMPARTRNTLKFNFATANAHNENQLSDPHYYLAMRTFCLNVVMQLKYRMWICAHSPFIWTLTCNKHCCFPIKFSSAVVCVATRQSLSVRCSLSFSIEKAHA